MIYLINFIGMNELISELHLSSDSFFSYFILLLLSRCVNLFCHSFSHFVFSPRYGFVYFNEDVNIQSIIDVSGNKSEGLFLLFFVHNRK